MALGSQDYLAYVAGGREGHTQSPQDDAHDICNPVVDVSASVEAGLYEFNKSAERRGSIKTGSRPKRPVLG